MGEPILKWAGGKRQLLTEITARFPVGYGGYHEPFVGGGAVFFALEPERGSINDINTRLINFYEVVQEWPDELIRENRTHEYTDEYYYNARDEFNELHTAEGKNREQAIREASLLLYLNRTCFNGLYRENSDGEFNVSIGNYTNPDWIRADAIKAAHKILQNTTIHNEDFEYVRNEVSNNDLVYFDPPYQPVSRTADFTSYHADGFDKEDQKRLRDVAVDLGDAGVYVVLSNSPPVAELYEEYEEFSIEMVEATRAINSDADNRDEVAEVLISNVPPDERQRKTLADFIE
jgi:DNA adenine methylase